MSRRLLNVINDGGGQSGKNESLSQVKYDKTTTKRMEMLKQREVVKLEYHTSPISVEQGRQEDIAIISFTDTETKNLLSYEQVQQLGDIITDIRKKHTLRVCILRSLVPNVFCAGANLKQRAKMDNHELRNWMQSQRELMDRVHNIPIPTIAAIEGYALGGGLEYALACDMIVVDKEAKVGLVETRLGIIPGAGGTQRLVRRIGAHKAKELIFTGRIIDGRTAYEYGIANVFATEPDKAFQRSLELANQITDKSPLSLHLAKLAINKGSEVDLATGLDIEQAYYGQLFTAQDRLEGLKAFFEKRKPIFRGE